MGKRNTSDFPLVLGINAAYHESAAAIIRGSEVLFAAEEERFTRVKHAKAARVTTPDQLPWFAIRACLQAANCKLSEVDAVAYSLVPGKRLAMIGCDLYQIADSIGFGTHWGERTFDQRVRDVERILCEAAEVTSFAAGFHFIAHHLAHAASAFHAAGMESAAVLVVDGIGETETTWLGRGNAQGLDMIEEIPYPHSIGLLWERIAVYLGFDEYDAAKVMGLAAFGDPTRFAKAMDRLFHVRDQSALTTSRHELQFEIDGDLARFRAGDVAGLESLFGPRRQPDESPLDARFADLAAALQTQTENALLELARRLQRATGETCLAYSGGVALNCVANSRLERDGPFERMHVYAAPHDAGTAIGAALETVYRIVACNSISVGLSPFAPRKSAAFAERKATLISSPFLTGSANLPWRIAESPLTPFLGSQFSDDTIDAALARWGLEYEVVPEPELRAAAMLAKGQIIAWFRGCMELGPRALGNRSFLADPRSPAMRDRLNHSIKHRESFRPFGASVLEDEAAAWFDLPISRPGASSCRDLMLFAYPVRLEKRSQILAVVHIDGTCRIQTVNAERQPEFHRLISAFARISGVPMVLNTSYNEQEPLVLTPDDALATFLRTGIDALFMNDRIVLRSE